MEAAAIQLASSAGLTDPDTALHSEPDLICARFPDRAREEIDRRLRTTHGRLSAGDGARSGIWPMHGVATARATPWPPLRCMDIPAVGGLGLVRRAARLVADVPAAATGGVRGLGE